MQALRGTAISEQGSSVIELLEVSKLKIYEIKFNKKSIILFFML